MRYISFSLQLKDGQVIGSAISDSSLCCVRSVLAYEGGGGGGGEGERSEVQKKYSRNGKFNEKKFMHAN